jgi:PKD repeat protein
MYRWDYVKGQRAPRAVLETDRTDGAVPLTVQFDGSDSSDPDPADALSFQWDFDGDGAVDSTDPTASFTYTTPGVYTARLTVTDSSGKTATANTTVTAGNTSPTVTVNVPVEGGMFAFGESIPFVVTVTDPEDAAIDCNRVEVTFVLAHDEHGHGGASTTGCSGSLPTDPDDVSHGGNVWGVISARYTDTGGVGGTPGLTTVAENNVRQKLQQVEFALNQSGTNTAATTDVGGGLHRGSLAPNDWIELNGPINLLNIDSVSFRVADTAAGRTPGSPLAAVELRSGASDGPILQTFNLASTGGTATWQTQTFPLTDPGGANRLFLRFASVLGGQGGNNLFNLNWVQFNGAGVTVVRTNQPGDVSGTVPATLSLAVGPPASFGAFAPGVGRTYEASMGATVTSSAGDATLSVTDPGPNAGRLVNGTFALAQPLMLRANAGAFAPLGGTPTTLHTYTGPVSNNAVTIGFQQAIGANEGLRTGTYSKTLTFTLSTTSP